MDSVRECLNHDPERMKEVLYQKWLSGDSIIAKEKAVTFAVAQLEEKYFKLRDFTKSFKMTKKQTIQFKQILE